MANAQLRDEATRRFDATLPGFREVYGGELASIVVDHIIATVAGPFEERIADLEAALRVERRRAAELRTGVERLAARRGPSSNRAPRYLTNLLERGRQ
jgi:hypothetical protein